MPKVTFEIPSDIDNIICKYTGVDWNKVVSDTLWNYAKKIKLLESITSKSKLTARDVEVIDHEVKAAFLNESR